MFLYVAFMIVTDEDLFIMLTMFKIYEKICSKLQKTWFPLFHWVEKNCKINEKLMFIWILIFFVLYHFWAFSRTVHYLQLFFQVFNNAFFMKKIQDSYWKKTIDKKKKRSKETQPTFFNIKALFSVDTNKLHYFPTTIWTKVVTF